MVYHLDGMGFQVLSQPEIVRDENERKTEVHSRPRPLGSPTDLLDSDVLLVTAP